MKIVVDIGHPAQVHFFKNFIWEMQKKGHKFLLTASEKEVAIGLLNALGFEYVNMGSYGSTLLQKILSVPLMNLKMYKAVKDMEPDLFLGFGSVRAAQVAYFMKKPCLIFDDDEFSFPYYSWFATTVCGFSGFSKSGKKILKIPSHKELAYLHPNWFSPQAVLQRDGPITLLRFVSKAFHDLGKVGFNLEFKRKLIRELKKHSHVIISSEAPLPNDLEEYRAKIRPEEMHHLLSQVSLLVTDSGTMTTEAAVLGVPAVRCDSFVGHENVGSFKELEERYGLVFNFKDPELALNKAVQLIQSPVTKTEWEEKRKCLLRDKIDVTSFMLQLIENYPDSFLEARLSLQKDGELLNEY